MDKKVNLPRLLMKIELYCILHNIKDWGDVPHHCYNCNHRDSASSYRCWSGKKNKKKFEFISDKNFRNFKKSPIGEYQGDSQSIPFCYSGCLLWKGKIKF